MNLKFNKYVNLLNENCWEDKRTECTSITTQDVLYSVSDVNTSTRMWMNVYLLVRKGGGGSDWKLWQYFSRNNRIIQNEASWRSTQNGRCHVVTDLKHVLFLSALFCFKAIRTFRNFCIFLALKTHYLCVCFTLIRFLCLSF